MDVASLTRLARGVFASSTFVAPRVIFLLGAPGSGKGSVCERLDDLGKHGVETISAGELLRASANDDDSIAQVLSAGGVVPPHVSATLILRRLEHVEVAPARVSTSAEARARRPVVVVDGFPRNIASARLWEASGARVERVLGLETGVSSGAGSELVHRLSARGRADDTIAVVARRLAQHGLEWPRLRAFYCRRKQWTPIDARGDVDDVWRRVHAFLRRSAVVP